MSHPARLCPCCGRAAYTVLHHVAFARIEGVSIHDGYDVVACAMCGMVYANDVPEQAAFDRYYAGASKYDGPASASDRVRLAQVADTISISVPNRATRILDVGCADGTLLRNLRARGFTNLVGMDPSPRVANLAPDLDVRRGTIASLDAWGESYDLITCVGVLEHLRDVGHCLDVLRARLAPGGALYVEVPDASGFSTHGTAPFQEFSPEHLNFFASSTLNATAARHGLTATMYAPALRPGPGSWMMPTLCAVLTRQDGPRQVVEQYCRVSKAADVPVLGMWTLWASGDKPFWLWGAGALSLRLLAARPPRALAGIIDSNPRYHGRTVLGVPIIPPEPTIADHPILIGSVAHADAIEAECRKTFPRNPVVRL